LLFKGFVPFRAVRVPARFSMLVGLSLSLLAGYGTARLAAHLKRPPLRLVLAAVLATAIIAECWSVRAFERVPVLSTVHPLYQWLAGRSLSPIVNLPLPSGEDLWDPECRYMYYSTLHWNPMVNGYSGAWPASYALLRDRLTTFPDDRSVKTLREWHVRYVVVHEAYLGRPRYAALVAAADARIDLKEVFRMGRGAAHARIYEVQTR
jgi:hypothetical protein